MQLDPFSVTGRPCFLTFPFFFLKFLKNAKSKKYDLAIEIQKTSVPQFSTMLICKFTFPVGLQFKVELFAFQFRIIN